ncbi:hypothetical protein C8J57DRAFT_1222937 [Mycena rebaudengoi]|nr:hypothetical protein C8J57DRAFT_1222937 [Mycena rebaudengoi]
MPISANCARPEVTPHMATSAVGFLAGSTMTATAARHSTAAGSSRVVLLLCCWCGYAPAAPTPAMNGVTTPPPMLVPASRPTTPSFSSSAPFALCRRIPGPPVWVIGTADTSQPHLRLVEEQRARTGGRSSGSARVRAGAPPGLARQLRHVAALATALATSRQRNARLRYFLRRGYTSRSILVRCVEDLVETRFVWSTWPCQITRPFSSPPRHIMDLDTLMLLQPEEDTEQGVMDDAERLTGTATALIALGAAAVEAQTK